MSLFSKFKKPKSIPEKSAKTEQMITEVQKEIEIKHIKPVSEEDKTKLIQDWKGNSGLKKIFCIFESPFNDAFRNYYLKIHETENFDYLKDYLDFKNASMQSKDEKWKAIYLKYIKERSRKEINIPGAMRSEIAALYLQKEFNQDKINILLETAAKEIYSLINHSLNTNFINIVESVPIKPVKKRSVVTIKTRWTKEEKEASLPQIEETQFKDAGKRKLINPNNVIAEKRNRHHRAHLPKVADEETTKNEKRHHIYPKHRKS